MPEQRPSLVSAIGDQITEPAIAALKRLIPGDAAGALVGPAVEQAAGSLRESLGELLKMPLDQVLTSAWRKYGGFAEFTDPAKHPPGVPHEVELAEHTVRWTQQPAIDVAFQGKALATLHLGIQVEVKIEGGKLVIQDAKFRSLKVGKLHIAALVSLEGDKVAEYEDTVEVPGELSFGEGIDIAEAAARAASAIPVPAIVGEPEPGS